MQQQQQLNQTIVIGALDLNKLKEYFISKNGRSKYSDLFNAFRDLIGSDPNNGLIKSFFLYRFFTYILFILLNNRRSISR